MEWASSALQQQVSYQCYDLHISDSNRSLDVNQSTEGHRASVVKLGPQATPGVSHHSPWTEVDELWGAGERKMGRGWQRARSMAGAGRTRKNFGLGDNACFSRERRSSLGKQYLRRVRDAGWRGQGIG